MECLLCARPVTNPEHEEKNKALFPALRRTLPIGGDGHIDEQLHCSVISARTERPTATVGMQRMDLLHLGELGLKVKCGYSLGVTAWTVL